jgi:hypothetical protein
VTGFGAHARSMYGPTPHSEIEGIVSYVEQQLDAIRAAATGLTDEQARLRPCRSALSIGGLIKHAAYCMRGVTERLAGGQGRSAIDEAAFAAYEASFALADDETAAAAIAAFDAARVEYVAALAAADPSAPTVGRAGATCSSTRSRRWRDMRATPTSSASRSTGCPSRRSC